MVEENNKYLKKSRWQPQIIFGRGSEYDEPKIMSVFQWNKISDNLRNNPKSNDTKQPINKFLRDASIAQFVLSTIDNNASIVERPINKCNLWLSTGGHRCSTNTCMGRCYATSPHTFIRVNPLNSNIPYKFF